LPEVRAVSVARFTLSNRFRFSPGGPAKKGKYIKAITQLINVLVQLQSSTPAVVNAGKLKKALAAIDINMMSTYEQQDAGECLRFLLQRLIVNTGNERSPLVNLFWV
jgi:hypothetical protein